MKLEFEVFYPGTENEGDEVGEVVGCECYERSIAVLPLLVLCDVGNDAGEAEEGCIRQHEVDSQDDSLL